MVAFEQLESRTLLAAEPAVLVNYLETSWLVDDPGFGGTRTTAAQTRLQPMMQTRITGDLTSGDVDMFLLDLVKGQYLSTGVSLGNTQLTLYDADAQVVARMNGPAALRQVPASGRYYLRLSDTLRNGTRRSYTLDIRPIGLNTSQADPELLQTDATGVYAIRDGSSLHIAGPTGHGFTLIGNWKQTSSGSGATSQTTFSASGTVKLRSIVGDIPIPIPAPASVRITTAPGAWGKYFGEIQSIDLGLQFRPMDLAAPFGRAWGMVFNNDIGGVNHNGGGFGVKLGGDPLLKDTGLPLNPTVPYLFYTDNKGFRANFGGIDANVAGSFGYAVVIDPGDSFFLGAKGVPVLGDVGFGVSAKGLIPFTPNAMPTGWNGGLFGNVFLKSGLDISAFNPAIPMNIDGDIVVDLDANNDGKRLGGLNQNISRMLANGLTVQSLGSTVDRVFGDLAIGVNGKASVGYEKSGFELSVPVGEGSLIYSGTRRATFVRGRSVNPFAGTPLEVFKPKTSIDIDGYAYRNGMIRLAASGTYNPWLYTMNASVVLDNTGVRASGTMKALGTNVRVNGSVLPSGRFTLTGDARVGLGPLSGTGRFTLRNTGSSVRLAASLSSRLSTTIAGVQVGGSVSASMSIGVNSRGLTYSGSGSASLFVGQISIGPSFSISNNQLAIGIDARPVLEAMVRVPLPA
jgi:hypothetical protein